MTTVLNILVGRDFSAMMSIAAVLIAGGLAKAGYAWWSVGVLAGATLLAVILDLSLRDLRQSHAL
ncbi:MAG: hypothetical protein ACXWKC_16660 [Xanthobacteraceae bacterium]